MPLSAHIKFYSILALASTTSTICTGKDGFDLRQNGGYVGTASLRREKSNNYLKFIVDLRFTNSTSIASEKSVDKNGVPLMLITRGTSKNGSFIRSIHFQPSKATVDLSLKGKLTTQIVPIPKGGTARNPSDLWFIVEKPKPGTRVSYWEIDDSSKWRKEVVQYVGPVKFPFRGKIVKGHYIKGQYMERWCDDAGSNYRIKWTEGKGSVEIIRKK